MNTDHTCTDESAVLLHGKAVLDRYIKLATQDSRRPNLDVQIRLAMIDNSSIRADGAIDALGSLCPGVHVALAQEFERARARFHALRDAVLAGALASTTA